jgi:O-antigen/teichoic acid export membrane protein
MKGSSGFYSSLGLLILLNVVIKPLWIFAIDRQVQNEVGVEVYGVYFSLFNLSIVFNFLADWGFTVFFNRQLAAREENSLNQPGNFLLLKLLLAVLYAGVVFITAFLSGIQEWDILIYVVLIQIFSSLLVFFRSIITAHQWFGTDAWLSITDKGLMILLCGSLLYYPAVFGSMNIDRFMLLQVVCLIIAVTAGFVFLLKKGVSFTISRNWLPDKKVFLQVMPFGITVLLMSAHYRTDAFLLERIHSNGAYEAGIYAGAYRLLDAATMGGYLVSAFMLPFIARRWSDKIEIGTVALQCRHFLMMSTAGIVSTVVMLAPWIQQVLYHHDDAYSTQVLQWCVPALVGYSLVQVYGTVLTATGRIVDFCYINLFAVVINITLNLALIPSMGAKGCCIAALSSQLFVGIVSMLYVKQKTQIDTHPRSLLIYIFTGILLAGFYYGLKDWPVGNISLIIMAAMITIAVILITKLVSFQALVGYWRRRSSN